jgi:hypothetical protein
VDTFTSISKSGAITSTHFFLVKITTLCNQGLNNIVVMLMKTLKSIFELKSGASISTTFYFQCENYNFFQISGLDNWCCCN